MTNNIIKLKNIKEKILSQKKDKNNTKINFTKATLDNLALPPKGIRYKGKFKVEVQR